MRSLTRVGVVLLVFFFSAPGIASDFEETKQEVPDPGYAWSLPPELKRSDLDLTRPDVRDAFRVHALCVAYATHAGTTISGLSSACASSRATLIGVLGKGSGSALVAQIETSVANLANTIR